MRTKLIIFAVAVFVVCTSLTVLANGKSPSQPITRINTMNYYGEDGAFISNCSGGGADECLITPSCAGTWVFWVPKSHPLYKTIISTAMVSITAKIPIELTGSGVCYPGASGYEIIAAADLR